MLSHGDPAVGCCTQFAILTRDDSPSPTATSATIAETAETTKSGTQEFYNLFSRIDYPTYETVHTDEEALEFLHDKIARIRPRPPLERTEDDYYDDYWINGCMQNGQVQDSGATEAKDNKESTPESEIELGVLDLEDLWGSLDVRQRCKRRSEFIRILGTSSLVRLDVAEDKIRYDEESAFWKEWDERDARRYALHDTLDPTGSDCNEYNDDDQYETEPYNEKHLSLVECQQEEGWDNQGQHFDSWSENVQSPWLQSSQSAWSETEWHTKHDTKDTEEVYSP
ncbi:hypothetical protein BC939DRAFT_19869 [Gamsiella multidivaricata]|uniref:uncharacterized protein n=1 Tax=Gamsiella multidivaricata TaxID=101098 RepID=UPI00221E4919|nr:uncharacterized protein BC939DRAFT_19869 [Gamsiella multidivaricata]KAI7817030.1 hypothetical protein BC939DRAFT_19869 [Gamsiella multidivaricata]